MDKLPWLLVHDIHQCFVHDVAILRALDDEHHISGSNNLHYWNLVLRCHLECTIVCVLYDFFSDNVWYLNLVYYFLMWCLGIRLAVDSVTPTELCLFSVLLFSSPRRTRFYQVWFIYARRVIRRITLHPWAHTSVRLYPHTLEEILIDLEPVTVLHSVHREVLRVELAEEFKGEHT